MSTQNDEQFEKVLATYKNQVTRLFIIKPSKHVDFLGPMVYNGK